MRRCAKWRAVCEKGRHEKKLTGHPVKLTLVAWHRYGKEHGETDEFRVNPQYVIDASIRREILRELGWE